MSSDKIEVSREQCDEYVWGYVNGFQTVKKEVADACASAYPDTFVTDDGGKRKVHMWHVDYTWTKWAQTLWGSLF